MCMHVTIYSQLTQKKRRKQHTQCKKKMARNRLQQNSLWSKWLLSFKITKVKFPWRNLDLILIVFYFCSSIISRFQMIYIGGELLLQRIHIQPELSNKNRMPLHRSASATLSKAWEGNLRVMQSRASNSEFSPGKARYTRIKLLTSSNDVLFLNNNIFRDDIEERSAKVNIRI